MARRSGATGITKGQWVRVRPEAEIAATLDASGKLDGMPFMPEMARHCGRILRVYRRAGKTCVEGHSLRRLRSTVLLEDLRCDGAFHDGCQRNCLFFWKEAWLEPVPGPAREAVPPSTGEISAWARGLSTRAGETYLCQSTALLSATEPLSRWNLTHFFGEIRDGELSIKGFLRILVHTTLDRAGRLLGLKRRGTLTGAEAGSSRGDLHLEAGEWVEVKDPKEIQRTLDPEGRNRGLSFEPDMVQFTGGRFEVAFPVQRIILEQTGKMVPLANTVALKGVACDGSCTMNCPRNNTLYWRETWLKRVERGS